MGYIREVYACCMWICFNVFTFKTFWGIMIRQDGQNYIEETKHNSIVEPLMNKIQELEAEIRELKKEKAEA